MRHIYSIAKLADQVGGPELGLQVQARVGPHSSAVDEHAREERRWIPAPSAAGGNASATTLHPMHDSADDTRDHREWRGGLARHEVGLVSGQRQPSQRRVRPLRPVGPGVHSGAL